MSSAQEATVASTAGRERTEAGRQHTHLWRALTARVLTWTCVKLLEGFVQNYLPCLLFLFIILFGCFRVCISCVSGDCVGQKNVLGSLEVKL